VELTASLQPHIHAATFGTGASGGLRDSLRFDLSGLDKVRFDISGVLTRQSWKSIGRDLHGFQELTLPIRVGGGRQRRKAWSYAVRAPGQKRLLAGLPPNSSCVLRTAPQHREPNQGGEGASKEHPDGFIRR
jgi:hypothetical protein